jgi:Flp pilus assembly protein TadD
MRLSVRLGLAGKKRKALAVSRGRVIAVLIGALFLSAALVGCGGELGRAHSLEREGDLSGAVAVYRTILQKNADDLQALNGLAVDLVLLREYAEALPVQERVVSLDREDVQTRVELGFNYLNHQDRPVDAVRVLSEASLLDPTAQHLTFLAQAQIRSGEDGRAEQTLRSAMEADPQYAHSYSVLSSLLLANGRTAEAAELKEEARLHGATIATTP